MNEKKAKRLRRQARVLTVGRPWRAYQRMNSTSTVALTGEKAMPDIHTEYAEAQATKLRRMLQRDFRRRGDGRLSESDEQIIESACNDLKLSLERSERMKAVNRRRRAEQRAANLDLFDA